MKNIDQIEKNIVKLSKNVEVEQSRLNNLTLLLEEKLKVKDSLVTNVSNSKNLYEEKTLEIANAKSSSFNFEEFQIIIASKKSKYQQ